MRSINITDGGYTLSKAPKCGGVLNRLSWANQRCFSPRVRASSTLLPAAFRGNTERQNWHHRHQLEKKSTLGNGVPPPPHGFSTTQKMPKRFTSATSPLPYQRWYHFFFVAPYGVNPSRQSGRRERAFARLFKKYIMRHLGCVEDCPDVDLRVPAPSPWPPTSPVEWRTCCACECGSVG